MTLWQFLFQFLYTRNWHSGELELSQPRLILFLAMLTLILLGVLIVGFLQTPVSYAR